MKKNIYKLTSALGLLLIVLAGCLPNDVKELAPVESVKVEIAYDASQFKNTAYAGKEVSIVGPRRTYTATSDDQGIVEFTKVIPGKYSLTISDKLPKDEYDNMINPPLGANDVLINGVINNMAIYDNYSDTLKLQVGVSQSLIISKVYYNGVKDDNGRNYSVDTYFEIYNNSDQEVSTENLYMGLTETESTPYFFEEREENLYLSDAFKFDAHMIPPGGSILVARQAKDHTETASASPNLSTADYETKSIRDTPNDNVPGIEHVYRAFATRDYLFLNTRGDIHMVLFRFDGDIQTLPKKQKPTATSPRLPFYVQVKVEWILDGIDIVKFFRGEPIVENKRLAQGIDASYQTTPNGVTYQGYSLDRKVASIADDGRYILQDTNNSIQDFAACTDNSPRKYDKPELLTNDE